MKYKITTMDVLTWACLSGISAIFLSITIQSARGKTINALALESVATIICVILVILGIVSLYQYRKKKISTEQDDNIEIADEEIEDNDQKQEKVDIEEEISKEETTTEAGDPKKKDDIEEEISKEETTTEAGDPKKEDYSRSEEQRKKLEVSEAHTQFQKQHGRIEEHSQYIDFMSTAIGCSMQIFMLCEQVFLDFFAKNPNAVMFRKIVDLFSTGLACCATVMLLTAQTTKYIQIKNQETGQKNENKTLKKQKIQMIILSTILFSSFLNFTGKGLGSFIKLSNIPLSAHSTFNVGALMRAIGIGGIVMILAVSKFIIPHNTITEPKTDAIQKNTKGGDTRA